MPLWVYFQRSPGSYCIGAASQSGTRSAQRFRLARIRSRRLAEARSVREDLPDREIRRLA